MVSCGRADRCTRDSPGRVSYSCTDGPVRRVRRLALFSSAYALSSEPPPPIECPATPRRLGSTRLRTVELLRSVTCRSAATRFESGGAARIAREHRDLPFLGRSTPAC
jgi:hypothetical protein